MPPPDPSADQPSADQPSADQARAAIQAALGQIGFCLPGTITIRHARCGKPRCACAADPPALHGPYIQWTRTVNGKTVTRLLTPAQHKAYAPWLANARRLRAPTPVPAGSSAGAPRTALMSLNTRVICVASGVLARRQVPGLGDGLR